MIHDQRAEKTLDVAEAVSDAMHSRNVPHALIGAVAMAVYGFARQTADIDFATCTDPFTVLRDVAQTLSARKGWHVELVTPDSDDPLGGVLTVSGDDFDPIQIVNFLNPFSPGASALVQEALDRASATGDSRFALVGLPYLIALKLYAGGMLSRSDVLQLLAANPGLDRGELTTLCDRFGLSKEIERAFYDFDTEAE